MDNIEISLRWPEEGEFAMSNLSPYSYNHWLFFPKNTLEIFDKSVRFKGLSESEKADWERQYLRVIKLASLSMDGKRPLLKSPANTARIPVLLKLFPNAKFIHIYRNPYVIFPSFRHTFLKLTKLWKLQDITVEEVEDIILNVYKMVMGSYFEERHMIPPENLIEIRYEDFEDDQINILEKIYMSLHLPDFKEVKPDFQNYIQSKSGYKKNSYKLEPAVIDRVYANWNFTIDHWGYTADQL